MSWKPDDEQRQFLNTIASMTYDCLMGNGTVDVETYLSNLRIMCDMMEKETKESR
jgi:hypothetical protein